VDGVTGALDELHDAFAAKPAVVVLRHLEAIPPNVAMALASRLSLDGVGTPRIAATFTSASGMPATPEHERLVAVLGGVQVHIPPLRERSEDIPLVASSVVRSASSGRVALSAGVMRAVVRAPWPGNILQMRSLLQGLATSVPGEIQLAHLPADIQACATRRQLTNLEHLELRAILDALKQAGGNKVVAAKIVGVSRSTLYRKLNSYRIDPDAHYLRRSGGSGATLLDLFEARLSPNPMRWRSRFGTTMDRASLDDLSERVARVFSDRGVAEGDRVIVSLQNTPVFCAALLACWKLGAIAIPVNPMVRTMELGHVASDSGAVLLVAEPSLAPVIEEVAAGLPSPLPVLWSSPGDFAGSEHIPFAADGPPAPAFGTGLLEALAALPGGAPTVSRSPRGRHDLALICYTSGTTGPPKGAMIRHANLTYQAAMTVRWYGLGEHEPVITLPPLFHITGMGQNLAMCLGNGLPLILTYRFEPRTVVRLIEQHRPVYGIAAITAFVALSAEPTASADNLGSVRALYCGGAAVPAGVVAAFQERFGAYIHNAYGLTECASVASRAHRRTAPVDPTSGALSIGRAVPGTTVSVVDDSGAPAAPGTIGEARRRRARRLRGLLGQARRDEPCLQGRRAAHGRRRLPGRGRVDLHRRPQEGPRRGQRVQGLAPRGRGRPLPARRGARGGRGGDSR
jgi:acyl-CoA synthetase (AMP-forming)/AMP-acid ligase II